MEHKKDIGKAIREKLKPLDKSPGDHLWAAIEADLPKKKKRRILPFWLSFISVIVIGLLLWTLLGNPGSDSSGPGRSVENNNGNPQNSNQQNNAGKRAGSNAVAIEQADQNAAANESATATGSASNTISDGKPVYGQDVESVADGSAGQGKAKRSAKNKEQTGSGNAAGGKKTGPAKLGSYVSGSGKSGDKKFGMADADESSGAQTGIANNDPNKANTDGQSGKDGKSATGNNADAIASKESADAKKLSDSLKKAIAEEKKKQKEKPKDSLKTEEIEQDSFKTFRIFLYAAPTYYNTFSKISSIDDRLDSVPRKAEITYNYGGYLSFDYDEKWAFRFGVARTDLRHRTQGIPVSTLNQQNYYNIAYNNNISNADLQDRFADSERFDLVQDISYLEFPIELKYKLTGDKFGIEGIGGVSTSLLKDNTVTAESDHNGAVVLGGTKNMYKAYFSVNIGVGFYYKFANNFRLNIEPIFKYHFRTASTALQPYSVVVLGGLEYTFNWRTKKKAEKK